MNSCFEAPDLDELHCATEVTGGALGRADDNQFFQEVSGVDARCLSGQPLVIPCDDLVGGKRHIIQPQVKVMAAPGRASLAGKLAGLPAGHKTGTHWVAGRSRMPAKSGFLYLDTSPFLGTISAQAHDFAEMRVSRSADRYTNPGHSDRDLSNGASLQRLRLLPLEF
jgi:hypothetical protein